MDHNLPIQEKETTHTKEPLDKIQNQAVKLICGATRTIPTAPCEIDSNIEPFDLRRKISVLQGILRYRRFEDNHPNWKLVDTWVPTRRLKQESLLDAAAKNLEEIHHFSDNMLLDQKFSDVAPWTNPKPVVIKTLL